MSRADQAQETKQKLLDAALALFAEQGYSKTSIRALARRTGLSDGILYHHFPDGKQEIFSVLMTQGVQQALSELNKVNQDLEQAPLADVLNTLCEMSVALFSTHRELLKIMMRESENMQLNEIHMISTLFETREHWLADLLAQRHEQGNVRLMDFSLAAQQFMALNLQYGLAGLFNLNIGCNMASPETRAQMIAQTVMLWSPAG